MDSAEKVRAFIEELEQLTQKHGMKIDACGCCESPWVIDLETGILANHVDYKENGTITYDLFDDE